jgi:hypothetical protein
MTYQHFVTLCGEYWPDSGPTFPKSQKDRCKNAKGEDLYIVKLISNEINRDSGAYKTALLAAFAMLALASPGAAAVATSVGTGMTSASPGGFTWSGTSNRAADEVQWLCQMDNVGRLPGKRGRVHVDGNGKVTGFCAEKCPECGELNTFPGLRF